MCGFSHEQTGPWWCLMGIPLAQVNSLNHPALTLAQQRCPHRWCRAVHTPAIGGRKHREILSESRANTLQGTVLIGGRIGFKYLKLNQTGWIVPYPCQVMLKDNLAHDLQPFCLTQDFPVFLLKPWPCKCCQKQRAVPRSSCVKAGRRGWFPGRTQQRLPCPCLVALFVHWEPQWWSDIKNFSRAELHSLCWLLTQIFVWVD